MPLRTLTSYRRKRDFKRTPEPSGAVREKTAQAPHFVVQKHWARQLHFDLRLEHRGILKSWAVPRDPPMRPGERRLAILVEDHPLEYRSFEGTIPEGNYGAGRVIIWDRGAYRVTGSAVAGDSERRFDAGFAKGRLELSFDGTELNGAYALVRMAGGGSRWLFIKKRDARERAERPEENPIVLNERSDVEADRSRAREVRAGDLSGLDLRGSVRAGMPHRVEPMPVVPGGRPFDRAGWVFEIEWDGCRAVSSVRRGSVSLYSGNDRLLNERFPGIIRALRKLQRTAIFDGEIVVLDERGRPDHRLLRNYPRTAGGRLVYQVFDILYLDGLDLRRMPLLRRKNVLREVVAPSEHLGLSPYVLEGGVSFFTAARENGFEGIMAKDGKSHYREGVRSGEWLEIRVVRQKAAGRASRGRKDGLTQTYEGGCIAKYGKNARKTISKEMHKYGKGKMTIGSKGGKVKSRKQAVAIGISEARKKGGRCRLGNSGDPLRDTEREAV